MSWWSPRRCLKSIAEATDILNTTYLCRDVSRCLWNLTQNLILQQDEPSQDLDSITSITGLPGFEVHN